MIMYPVCNSKHECFAKKNNKCMILMETYKDNCPFQKPEREVTDGKHYPINETYVPYECDDVYERTGLY